MYVCLTNGDFYERWREHDCVRVGSWLLLGFNTLNILDRLRISKKKSNTNLSKGRAFAREKEREREREKRVLSSNDEFFFFFF